MAWVALEHLRHGAVVMWHTAVCTLLRAPLGGHADGGKGGRVGTVRKHRRKLLLSLQKRCNEPVGSAFQRWSGLLFWRCVITLCLTWMARGHSDPIWKLRPNMVLGVRLHTCCGFHPLVHSGRRAGKSRLSSPRNSCARSTIRSSQHSSWGLGWKLIGKVRASPSDSAPQQMGGLPASPFKNRTPGPANLSSYLSTEINLAFCFAFFTMTRDFPKAKWSRHIMCFVPQPSTHLVLLMWSIMKITITNPGFFFFQPWKWM